MTTDRTIRLLKIAFWIGAVTDALAAIIMIFPDLRVLIFGSENEVITPDYRYALGMGASLMVGWTVLLIWGSLKPVERRGLLVLTVFPVISGIVLAQIYAVSSGYISLKNILPVWIHLTLISSFFMFSYFSSKRWSQT
ncbi:hypothetical protein [Maribellus sediminis]|uniref:hypothetical protein n=1 Tax=Maribellus sediminis TaxID=2696285 RepID=UPI0014313DB5|nr:hypothetical protein [Maribellus sediminis]